MEGKEDVLKTNLVKWFSKLSIDSINLAGEKGANIAELFNNHFPIPNGFVVTTESYLYFLSSTGIDKKINSLLKEIDLEDNDVVESVCAEIKEKIVNSEFPEDLKEEILDSYENLGVNKIDIEKGSAFDILNNANESIFVSVRSSLPFKKIHSTNGVREQNTYLNVKGGDSLILHVKNCFASLFNVSTVKRILKEGDIEDLKIAVVIQQMVESEKSGEIISRNSDKNIIINSIWGLGEGMSLENSKSDEYVLNRDLDILNKKIADKEFYVVRDSAGILKMDKASDERREASVLNNYEIQRLGDFAEKIEIHFNKPQKVEFAIDENQIYLMQTRELNNSKILHGVDEGSLKKDSPNLEIKKQSDLIKEEILEEEKKIDEEVGVIDISRVEKITKTKLKLILDSHKSNLMGVKTGLKKVGVLKLEDTIKESGKHPLFYLSDSQQYENLISSSIEKVFDKFEEVWVRLSDFKSDEFSNLDGASEIVEKNPILGLHGIRFLLKYPELLKAELKAIKKFSDKGVVGILLPNLISLKEIREFKKYLGELEFSDVKLSLIIETPAAVQLIKEFCQEGIDMISIDLNHLMQCILAIDLENKEVSSLSEEIHPALLYQLEYMIRVCKRKNIETSVYGVAINNDEVLEYLIQKGIDFIFVVPKFAKDISEKVFNLENKILGGTDKEPRKYELLKENQDYVEPTKKEKVEDEKKVLDSMSKIIPKTNEELEQEIELIEKEKNEYLKNKAVEDSHSILGEHSKEEFDSGIENFEDDENVSSIEEKSKNNLGVEQNLELSESIEDDDIIGETKSPLNEDSNKKDPLGIF